MEELQIRSSAVVFELAHDGVDGHAKWTHEDPGDGVADLDDRTDAKTVQWAQAAVPHEPTELADPVDRHVRESCEPVEDSPAEVLLHREQRPIPRGQPGHG